MCCMYANNFACSYAKMYVYMLYVLQLKFTANNGLVTLKLSISHKKRDIDHHSHSNKYLLSNDIMMDVVEQVISSHIHTYVLTYIQLDAMPFAKHTYDVCHFQSTVLKS